VEPLHYPDGTLVPPEVARYAVVKDNPRRRGNTQIYEYDYDLPFQDPPDTPEFLNAHWLYRKHGTTIRGMGKNATKFDWGAHTAIRAHQIQTGDDEYQCKYIYYLLLLLILI
jgi:hypothetical protein